MFEQAFVTGRKTQTTRNVGLAIILQSIAVALLVFIPMMFVQNLPEERTVSYLIAPPLTLPPPPPAAGRTVQPKVVKAITPKVFNPKTLTEPKTIAKIAADLPQPELAALPSAGGVAGGAGRNRRRPNWRPAWWSDWRRSAGATTTRRLLLRRKLRSRSQSAFGYSAT
jgi:hypothetical protein